MALVEPSLQHREQTVDLAPHAAIQAEQHKVLKDQESRVH